MRGFPITLIQMTVILSFTFSGMVNARGEVTGYTLENGMKLLVLEDHRSPVVVSQIWYRVGGSYEKPGQSGKSHMLEHMMFKGTEKHPSGEARKIIAENGGEENAYTSLDFTVYHQMLEAGRLEVALELEADRMRNLRFLPEEFASEREVVIQERKWRIDDNPNQKFFERFRLAAYASAPYRQPNIGYQQDIERITLEDLKKWYQTWYAPNNAVLVVAGDVQPSQVHELVKKQFGKLETTELPAYYSVDEIESLGEKRITVRLPAKLGLLAMGFRVPTFVTAEDDWEPYALLMLAAVMDQGGSSRLVSELVRGREIAAFAGVSYNAFGRYDAQFTWIGRPTSQHTMAEVEAAFWEQIDRLKIEKVDEIELERIKAQVIAQKIYDKDSLFSQAEEIGMLESIGLGWKYKDQYIYQLKQVTPEQVQAVAQKYLVRDRLTTGILEPVKEEAN